MGVAIWGSRQGRTQGGQVKAEWDGVCVHTYQQGLAISGQVYGNIAEKAGCLRWDKRRLSSAVGLSSEQGTTGLRAESSGQRLEHLRLDHGEDEDN